MMRFDAERYRQSLRRRWLLMMVLSVSALALCVVNLVMLFVDGEGSYAFAGSLAYMMLTVVQSHVVFTPSGVSMPKCLKDDTLLKRVWNEEHDERRMLICAKAGVPLIPILGMIHYVIGLALLFVDKKIAAGILIASLLFMTASNIQYTIWQKRLSEEDTDDEA